MATYLLLWNPEQWGWSEAVSNLVTRRSEGAKIIWACGMNRSLVRGDRVFLIRTEREPRGIIGAGWVVNRPIEGADWETLSSRRAKTSFFVSLRVEAFRNPESETILELEELRRLSRGYFSRIPTETGMSISDDVAELIEERWRNLLGKGRQPVLKLERQAIEGLRTETITYSRGRSRALRDRVFIDSAGICEACRVDFSTVLNGMGMRSLQVHHRKQLASTDKPQLTKVSDLAVVCANCHSLIHMNPKEAVKVEELREWLEADRGGRAKRRASGGGSKR